MSPKINSTRNFCYLGKSQFTLLLVLINFISAVFHAYEVVSSINFAYDLKNYNKILYQKVKYNHEIAISFKYCNSSLFIAVYVLIWLLLETAVAKSQPNVSPQVCNINCFNTSCVFSFFGDHILTLQVVNN